MSPIELSWTAKKGRKHDICHQGGLGLANGSRIPPGACQPIFKAARSLRKCFFVGLMALPSIKTTHMAGAFPNNGYHISEEESGYFLSCSLQGCSESATPGHRTWLARLRMGSLGQDSVRAGQGRYILGLSQHLAFRLPKIVFF